MGNNYDKLAAEYYDPIAHPTCANFRELSIEFIQRHLAAPLRKDKVLEVGAGNSVVAEVLSGRGENLSALTITDESESMLNHSRNRLSEGATLKRASATNLPFSPCSFDLIISSLGDPYNDEAFWQQCSRVLRHTGRVLFSTPSFDWARGFRSHKGRDRAEFEMLNGTTIEVDSLVYSLSDQIDIIRSAGLAVDLVDFYYTENIRSAPSSKLVCGRSGSQVPVLWGIIATKPALKR